MQSHSFLSADDILTPARAEAINSTQSSLTAVQDTQMLAWIQYLENRFIEEAHTKHTLGGWSWTRKVRNFQTIAKTTLSAAITSTSPATFSLTSGTGFDATGRIAIETAKGAVDFVDCTISGSTATPSTTAGADVVSMTHASGEKVHKLYALPSDYGKTFRLLMGEKIDFQPHRDIILFPDFYYFTEIGSYILLPRDIGAQDFTHYYFRKGNTISALTTETSIPKMGLRWAVEMTLMHLFRIRRKREDIATSVQLAEMEMSRMLNYDKSISSQNASHGLRTSTFR